MNPRFCLAVILVSLFLLFGPTRIGLAQGPESAAIEVQPDSAPTVEDLRASKKAFIDEIQAMGGEVSSAGVITTPAADKGEPELGVAIAGLAQGVLARIDAQISLLELEAEADQEVPETPETLEGLVTADGATDFNSLDQVLDQLEEAKQATIDAEEEEEEIALGLKDMKRRTAFLEKRLRLEKLEGLPPDRAEQKFLRWQTRVAQQDLNLETLRVSRAQRIVQNRRDRVDYWQAEASSARDRIQVSTEDLTAVLAQIAQRLKEEKRLLSQLETSLEDAHGRWIRVQGSGPGLMDDRSNATAATGERAYRRALVVGLESERQIRIGRLELSRLQEDLWRHRYAAAGVGEAASRAQRFLRLEEIQRETERGWREVQRGNDELNSWRLSFAERGSGVTNPAIRRWVDRESEVLEKALELGATYADEVRGTRALAERTLAETRSESPRFLELKDKVVSTALRLWEWELVTIDTKPITFGKVFLALLMIIVGWMISKRISRKLSTVLIDRFAVSIGAAHALRNLVFYLLVVAFFLWGFHLVGIPLTVFTLLGGVVAIGLGFGSQNVVNNFISGLILLIERPIKVGDLIDVDGVLGSVERIGLRSTMIRPGNNTQIFIPNSSFLEKNVLNWTGSDPFVRSSVDVGVAYGSPVEKVRDLMVEAMAEEPKVRSHPSPEVLFVEFGDSSLLFRGYFWLQARQGLDTERAQSALRFRLDKLLGDAGIVIAFPQRDIHLDTLAPLQIQLTDQDGT